MYFICGVVLYFCLNFEFSKHRFHSDLPIWSHFSKYSMINVNIDSFHTSTYPIAIQNSMYGSQIFVNSDIKEILEFKARLATSY